MGKELTMDRVIGTYITLRKQKAAIDDEVKERLLGIKEKMLKLEAWIQTESDKTGVKSFKTDAGTAFLSTSDFATVADWDEVLEYVKANEAWDILTHGVNKRSVREVIDATKQVPNGVNFGTKIGVSVRAPAKKAED